MTMSQNDIPADFSASTAALQDLVAHDKKTSTNSIDASPQNGQHWHVWKAADRLEKEGLLSCLPVEDTRDLTQRVVAILNRWGETFAGKPGWQGLLNKSSLLHEIEESIVALHSLTEWMDDKKNNDEIIRDPIIIVDVCCGKGVFSMLASYVFQDDPRVKRIVMLDKADIKWNHVDAANGSAVAEKRPMIETWGCCNLHEIDQVVDQLEAFQNPLALIGIHLCKTLSPTCVGIVNAIGPDRCPFLCLAPCCLPRALVSQADKYMRKGNPIIEVPQYESQKERQDRRVTTRRRDDAMQRGQRTVCYMCQSAQHHIQKCSLLPTDEMERIDIFKMAAAAAPCWKCGRVGHNKADCPSDQTSSKPSLARPPVARMDVSNVLESEKPFDAYCCLLAGTLQRDQVRLMETGLVNVSAQHQDKNEGNSGRKSIYIVATQ
jgi:hypothetical protein